jgi:hypothetical protein
MEKCEVSSGETHFMTVRGEGVEVVNNQDGMVVIYANAVNTINFRYSKTANVCELAA